MEGTAPQGVFDLVAATGAAGGDNGGAIKFANVGKEHQLTDLLGERVVLFFVAEAASHTAAARGDNGYFMAFWQGKSGDSSLQIGKRFLVAMPVQMDGAGGVVESVCRDTASLDFGGEKLFKEKAVGGKGFGFEAQISAKEIGELIAEPQDSRRLDTYEGRGCGDFVGKEGDIGLGESACFLEQAFGEEGSGALRVGQDDDGVAESAEELVGGQTYLCFVVIGKFIEIEVERA